MKCLQLIHNIHTTSYWTLHAQLTDTLTSFELNEDIGSQQEACVLFTMQLIYGTLHTIPLEQWRNSMQLCIYYFQISSIHDTIMDYLTDAPEEQTRQKCTELFDDARNKWTTHAKTLLDSKEEALSKLETAKFNNELCSTTIPALLKDETQSEQMRLAAEYIWTTLVDLTTTETTRQQTRKLADSQEKLLEQEEPEAAMVWQILKSQKPQELCQTTISNLLTMQVELLQEELFNTTENETGSEGSTECNCEKCCTNAETTD